jgi:hypothetical protein
MRVMKLAASLLFLSLIATGLAACDNSPPLRDNYQGQSLIEPDLLPQLVLRDEDGNPIPPGQPRDNKGFWKSLKIW